MQISRLHFYSLMPLVMNTIPLSTPDCNPSHIFSQPWSSTFLDKLNYKMNFTLVYRYFHDPEQGALCWVCSCILNPKAVQLDENGIHGSSSVWDMTTLYQHQAILCMSICFSKSKQSILYFSVVDCSQCYDSNYQDPLNHCPMPINTNQNCAIDPNADYCRSIALNVLLTSWSSIDRN